MNNQALIYDDQCPLCRWYSGQFVKHGLLANRIPFTGLDGEQAACDIDWDRARHEIPLHDFGSGQTRYGLDSLVYLLGRKLPLVAWGAKLPPVYWFFRQLYSLVSYNRRVIIPTPPAREGLDCAPDFHPGYRLGFIGLAWVVAIAVGYGLAKASGLGPVVIWLGLGLLVVQVSAGVLPGRRGLALAGQLASSLLVGTLSMLPLVGLMAWLGTCQMALFGLAVLVGLLVFCAQLEWRLTKLAGHLG
jgi:predicted DCC family thiol-disulfide oxidoreductase YuxK